MSSTSVSHKTYSYFATISCALYYPIPLPEPLVEVKGLRSDAIGSPLSRYVFEIIMIYSLSRLIMAKRIEGTAVSNYNGLIN